MNTITEEEKDRSFINFNEKEIEKDVISKYQNTEELKKAIECYSDKGSVRMNRYLRNEIEEIPPDKKELLEILLEYVNSYETIKDYVFYRGTTNVDPLCDKSIGDIVTIDNGFSSFSLYPEQAEYKAHYLRHTAEVEVIYILRVKARQRVGAFTFLFSKWKSEMDFLVKPHCKFKLLKKEVEEREQGWANVHIYELEAIE